MTAYVHIGKHKTGTTTIQNFMAKNYEILKEKGFVFAKSATFNNQHLPFVNTLNYLADAHEDIKLNYEDNWVFKAFKKEINENPNKIFIFSSEGFSLRSNREKSVKILKEMLKKLGFTEIKIIIYLRNQADSMVSVSSQNIKHGHHPEYKTPANNNSNNIFFDKNIFFNYKQAVSNYLNTFGKENLIVKLFDKNEFYEGDLIKDFLHILGLKLDDSFILPPNQNESLDLIG
ncbi:sulfotransferase domain-containing protein, partial [uncultured Campylobacter sp.]|uniref:sulfotransferase domain-containing protein n=1 Tax=uncultured Campylobacter sp. TaxID=218934 RepID=UPI002627DFE7